MNGNSDEDLQDVIKSFYWINGKLLDKDYAVSMVDFTRINCGGEKILGEKIPSQIQIM